MKKAIALFLILCCAMLALSSSALALTAMEQDVFDSVLIMLDDVLWYSRTPHFAEDFGFPADCSSSDVRVYELLCFRVDNGSDYAFIRYSVDGEPMEEYFGLYIETYGCEEARRVDELAFSIDGAQNGSVVFAHYTNMDQGFFNYVYLTDEGVDLMADSRSETYIKNINTALDNHWR